MLCRLRVVLVVVLWWCFSASVVAQLERHVRRTQLGSTAECRLPSSTHHDQLLDTRWRLADDSMKMRIAAVMGLKHDVLLLRTPGRVGTIAKASSQPIEATGSGFDIQSPIKRSFSSMSTISFIETASIRRSAWTMMLGIILIISGFSLAFVIRPNPPREVEIPRLQTPSKRHGIGNLVITAYASAVASGLVVLHYATLQDTTSGEFIHPAIHKAAIGLLLGVVGISLILGTCVYLTPRRWADPIGACLVGGLSGLVFSLWMLSMREGGLIRTQPGRWGFIAALTASGFCVDAIPRFGKTTVPVFLCVVGAMSTVIGIDTLTCAGLKENFLLCLGFRTLSADYGIRMNTGIMVELVSFAILALLGWLSQVKLHAFLKSRLEARRSSKTSPSMKEKHLWPSGSSDASNHSSSATSTTLSILTTPLGPRGTRQDPAFLARNGPARPSPVHSRSRHYTLTKQQSWESYLQTRTILTSPPPPTPPPTPSASAWFVSGSRSSTPEFGGARVHRSSSAPSPEFTRLARASQAIRVAQEVVPDDSGRLDDDELMPLSALRARALSSPTFKSGPSLGVKLGRNGETRRPNDRVTILDSFQSVSWMPYTGKANISSGASLRSQARDKWREEISIGFYQVQNDRLVRHLQHVRLGSLPKTKPVRTSPIKCHPHRSSSNPTISKVGMCPPPPVAQPISTRLGPRKKSIAALSVVLEESQSAFQSGPVGRGRIESADAEPKANECRQSSLSSITPTFVISPPE